MNACDFITREEFDNIKAQIKVEGKFRLEKEVKVNGNRYALSWHNSRYCESLGAGCFVSAMVDYNFENNGHRDIGGGNFGAVPSYEDTYDSFCDKVNDSLKHYPDYSESEPIQLSLF